MTGGEREFYPPSRGLIPRTALQLDGALAGIRTPDLLGHYSSCSTGLSYKRVRRQVRFQAPPVRGQDADGRSLSYVGRVVLDDEGVRDFRLGKSSRQTAKVSLIARMERNGIGASAVLFDERLAGSVDELGGLCAERKISADDAVVRQVLVNGNA